MSSLRTKATTITAIGAAALGGAALANAASSGTSTTSSTAASSTANGYGGQHRQGPPRDASKGGHMHNGKTEKLLTGDTAAKVKAAAEAKISGGTVLRVENDVDSGSPYEAHVRKADGSEVVVYVSKDFKVTSTEAHGPR